MEDEAQRHPSARAHCADAVAHLDAVVAARSGYGAFAHGEDDGLPLFQRRDMGL